MWVLPLRRAGCSEAKNNCGLDEHGQCIHRSGWRSGRREIFGLRKKLRWRFSVLARVEIDVGDDAAHCDDGDGNEGQGDKLERLVSEGGGGSHAAAGV